MSFNHHLFRAHFPCWFWMRYGVSGLSVCISLLVWVTYSSDHSTFAFRDMVSLCFIGINIIPHHTSSKITLDMKYLSHFKSYWATICITMLSSCISHALSYFFHSFSRQSWSSKEGAVREIKVRTNVPCETISYHQVLKTLYRKLYSPKIQKRVPSFHFHVKYWMLVENLLLNHLSTFRPIFCYLMDMKRIWMPLFHMFLAIANVFSCLRL